MTSVWNPTPPTEALPQGARLALHATAPAFLVMTANAVLMAAGGGADLPVFQAGPPAWAMAVIWISMLVVLGVARYEVARAEGAETFAVDVLLVAAMIYPFTARAFGADWTAANTLTVLAIAAMAAVAAFPQSRRGALLVAPAVAWMAWSSLLAIADVAAG